MANEAIHTTVNNRSLLAKFDLYYEMDKTWSEAKHDVRTRTKR